MRERFKGTGSMKVITDNEEHNNNKSVLTKEKREILDLWNIDEMDESDRESLLEKYKISRKELDIYSEKVSDNSEEIQITKEFNSNLPGNTDILQQKAGAESDNNFNNPAKPAEITESFLQKSQNSSFFREATEMKSGFNEIKKQDVSEPVQYNVKNMDILMEGTKTDPKDIKLDLRKKSGKHDILNLEFNIKPAEISKYIYLICTKDIPIEINLNSFSKESGREDFKRIFDGVLDSGEVSESKGEFSKVSLTAYSYSVLMDRVKHYRIFQ